MSFLSLCHLKIFDLKHSILEPRAFTARDTNIFCQFLKVDLTFVMLHLPTLASSGILPHTNLESGKDIDANVTLMLWMLNQMCSIVVFNQQAGIWFNPHERSIRVLSSMFGWIKF
jgi:hypothetical protein